MEFPHGKETQNDENKQEHKLRDLERRLALGRANGCKKESF